MVQMHSSRKVVNTTNRSISVTFDEENVEIPKQSSNEELSLNETDQDVALKPVFQCNDCEYKSDDRKVLMQHVGAINLFPQMLRMEQPTCVTKNKAQEEIRAFPWSSWLMMIQLKVSLLLMKIAC